MDVETRNYIKQHGIIKVIRCIREDVNELQANHPLVQDKVSLQVITGHFRAHFNPSFLEIYSGYSFTHSNTVCSGPHIKHINPLISFQMQFPFIQTNQHSHTMRTHTCKQTCTHSPHIAPPILYHPNTFLLTCCCFWYIVLKIYSFIQTCY